MRFVQPMAYDGTYPKPWAGYIFKEELGYTSGRHTGVDYNGPGAGDADMGMEIFSISTGIVRYVGDKSGIGFGKTTIIEYPLDAALQAELGCKSLFGRYMHQRDIFVQAGQTVSVGQVIGTVGDTGTDWAHLHLDLYKDSIGWGGVHFNYDKNSRLESYLDPFLFIESHKVDTAPQGGNDMAEKITVDTSRILTHGILARNGVANRAYSLDGNAGGNDLIGQDLTNALVQRLFLSDEGRDWRDSGGPSSVSGINARLAAAGVMQQKIDEFTAKLGEMQKIIDNLSARPTNEEYARTQALLQEKVDELSVLRVDLEKAKRDASKTVYIENPETGKKLDLILKNIASLKGMVTNLFKAIKQLVTKK